MVNFLSYLIGNVSSLVVLINRFCISTYVAVWLNYL